MFGNKNNNNSNIDDLINSSGQPIIVQESSGDKKFLYTLLILLVVLFLIALGLIAFLGSKYFGNNNEAKEPAKVVQQSGQSQSQKEAKAVAKEVAAQVVQEHKQKAKESQSPTSDLEKLVQEEESPKKAAKPKTQVEQAINKVAGGGGSKGLSQADLAKIAKLVAQELQKNQKSAAAAKNSAKSSSNSAAASSNDAALVASLQNAEADTLQEEKIDESTIKNAHKIKAGNSKKVDTFNKVVVENKSGSEDDLAKLSSEIDTILQSEDVKKQEQNSKYKKDTEKELAVREGEMRFITVKKGDTLSSIAYKAYGNWASYVKIYRANPGLVKNPNRIYIGMKLRVPVDAEYIANQAGK